ncbi:hypothetical protein BN946_scf185009.g21 [Trametes cinnabarina]|uniref:Transposase family Tnp2 protein n=1 Tax=Pycnoporus cinnabarinus TaxID=5643 RepID=A0A060S722_PYCCI|nr:hypothetical protein BN946_scf185009.g21 [Trametes cinnabarina]
MSCPIPDWRRAWGGSLQHVRNILKAVSETTFYTHASHRQDDLFRALDRAQHLPRQEEGNARPRPSVSPEREQANKRRRTESPIEEDPELGPAEGFQDNPRQQEDNVRGLDQMPFHERDIEEAPPPRPEPEVEDPEYGRHERTGAPPDAQLEDLRFQQQIIDMVKNATLETSGMSEEGIARMRDPRRTLPDLENDPDYKHALRLWLANGHSEKAYRENRLAAMERDRTLTLPTYEGMEKLIAELTGVEPIKTDMCITSCCAYTGPYARLEHCPYCTEARYRMEGRKRVARRTFNTLPLGPQLQSQCLSSETAALMACHKKLVAELLARLDLGWKLENIEDFYCSTDYRAAVDSEAISPDDFALMFSVDGAQLYEHKASDCWIYIWIIFELGPDKRYKKRYVFPGAIIPGPRKPRNLESFLFPGLAHISALQKEGLKIWDAANKRLFTSFPVIIFATADSPAMAYLNGLVGHHGAQGCRLYCPLRGRRKPNGPHYYPAMLKPLNYYERGCDHQDVTFDEILSIPPGFEGSWSDAVEERYRANLNYVVLSPNQTQFARRRLETGIAKPSIFDGLPRGFGVPRCFPGDIMHHVSLNLTDLVISLLRGTMRCDKTDDISTWDWACLADNDTWEAHGHLVSQATQYLPGSFGRPPRNPAEKINSGYKAWEYLYYVFGLLPGLLWGIQKPAFYAHFCKLVAGVRVALLLVIPVELRQRAHELLLEFVQEFEEVYYQRRVDRLHFVRQSLHALIHLIPEGLRMGPASLYSQWVLETLIGNLTAEIRSHVEPYANLSNRATRRSQCNALMALYPMLAPPADVLPEHAVELGDEYILMRARDRGPRLVKGLEEAALREYLEGKLELGLGHWKLALWKWARVRLPNGQIARTAWKECAGEARGNKVRRSRMVKLKDNRFAEIQYFFRLTIPHMRVINLAMISVFTPPDDTIRRETNYVLLACGYQGTASREVVDIKDITSVVAMVPLPKRAEEAAHPRAEELYAARFFVIEKLGLDMAWFGRVDIAEEGDNVDG